ncbi:hypothetical protein A2U01_0101346, partial [Trifolium medium]|nr:hypothetical protein [Trifolium medium]
QNQQAASLARPIGAPRAQDLRPALQPATTSHPWAQIAPGVVRSALSAACSSRT